MSSKTKKKSGGKRRPCAPGTPVKCHLKVGKGTAVLYCGKRQRPIELKAGKGGQFVPVGRASAAKKGSGKKRGPKTLKAGTELYPFAS